MTLHDGEVAGDGTRLVERLSLMATCKWCGRSGVFLSLTKIGVCQTCHTPIAMEATSLFEVMNESADLIEQSTKLDTQLSRCDLIVDYAGRLVKYEEKGVLISDPSPSQLVEKYKSMRDHIILEGLKREYAETLNKVASSPKMKVTQLSRFLLRVRGFREKANNPDLLDTIESELTNVIHAAQIRVFLEAATKAEFMGQRKKALNQYYEALYFLRHDEIDDALQTEYISTLETKIVELGGQIPTQLTLTSPTSTITQS